MWSLVRLTDPLDMTIVAEWDTGIKQEKRRQSALFLTHLMQIFLFKIRDIFIYK